MAQEVGVAYVSLLPSGRGFGKSVEGQIDSAIGKSEKKTDGFFSKVGTGIKRVGLGVAALAGTVGALAVGGGISRALNIEDAQAKLKGLGHDTEAIETIMTNALGAVKGTAFGLDAAATTAASAVASGIKPGQELEKYLRLTADAATIAGISMEEMGSIINKVQAKGVAQMEDLNRLTERGIPILQMLADEYGVTAEEMSDMVSRGEVDSERFRKALEDNVGGAALASGETTRGALANLGASVSRLGEIFAGPALVGAKEFFNELTIIFDGIADRIRPWADEVSTSIGEAFQIEGLGDRVLSSLDELTESVSSGPLPALLDAFAPLIPLLAEVGEHLGPALADSFVEIMEALEPVLPMLAESLTDALIEIIPALVEIIEAIAPLLPQFADLATELAPALVQALLLLTPLLGWLAENLTEVLTALSDVISLLRGDTTMSDYGESVEGLRGDFGELMQTVFDVGLQIGFFIGNLIQGFKRLYDGFTLGLTTILLAVRNTWDSVVGTVAIAVARVVSTVSALPGLLTSALTGAGVWLIQVGRDIIQGLINGVSSMIGNAVAAVRNVGGAMLDGVKDFLGIHSPSRVFRDEVGKMVGLGLLEGVADQAIAGRIDTAVSHLVSVPEDARSAAFPGAMTLLDADGSIMTRARVLMNQEIDVYSGQRAAARRRTGF